MRSVLTAAWAHGQRFVLAGCRRDRSKSASGGTHTERQVKMQGEQPVTVRDQEVNAAAAA